jgi:hypothetical protein
VVEGESQLEQEAPLDDSAGEPGISRVSADGAEEDHFVRLERIEGSIRKDLACRQEVTGAEGILGDDDVHVVRDDGAEHFHRLGDHFGPYAVTGDHGEVNGARHPGSLIVNG